MSVYSGPSQLFLLMFLLTAGIAALLLAAAVLLFIRSVLKRGTFTYLIIEGYVS